MPHGRIFFRWVGAALIVLILVAGCLEVERKIIDPSKAVAIAELASHYRLIGPGNPKSADTPSETPLDIEERPNSNSYQIKYKMRGGWSLDIDGSMQFVPLSDGSFLVETEIPTKSGTRIIVGIAKAASGQFTFYGHREIAMIKGQRSLPVN